MSLEASESVLSIIDLNEERAYFTDSAFWREDGVNIIKNVSKSLSQSIPKD